MSERWICSVCGYIHKGSAPPRECPSCGAPFTAFEKRLSNPRAKFRKIKVVEPNPDGHRYLILGNSAAGRSAARAIQALHPRGEVTVVTEEKCAFYSRPTLPDLLGGMDVDDFFAIGTSYPDDGLILAHGETASRIDRDAKKVVCESGRELEYDSLLVATGSAPIQIPWPGSEAEGIAYFRTYEDAQKILVHAEKATHAVVVGGGLLGLEFVRAFHARGVAITQLVREPRVGAPGLDEEAGKLIQKALTDWGVTMVMEDEVESFEAKGGSVSAVVTKKGQRIDCDLVGVAIGARPRIQLAEDAGLKTDRGIFVDSRFRTSDPSIYAAGDVAQAHDIVYLEQRVNTSWRNSQEQGEFAGVCMAGGEGEYEGALAANFQLAAGLPFCALGASNPRDPENYEIETTVDEAAMQLQKLVKRQGVLVGAVLVGDLGAAGDLEKEIRESEPPPPASAPSKSTPAPAPENDTQATQPQAEEKSTMRSMTEDNIKAAFAGESQAHMKYLNFAVKAAAEGKENVARLFQAASFAEQVHASKHLDVMSGIGSTSENLAGAMGGENYEVEEMYPAFMVVAEEQEEFDAHQSFNYAYQAEIQHHAFYERAKAAVDAGSDADFGAIQVCPYCGHTVEGEAPDKCPVCGAKKDEFKQF